MKTSLICLLFISSFIPVAIVAQRDDRKGPPPTEKENEALTISSQIEKN